MPTTTRLASQSRTANPIALWHLLSLDAPTVAALWTWFIARACHIRLPFAAPAAMGLAVWMLYAADRLLDARLLDGDEEDKDAEWRPQPGELEARHLFHHRHRRPFLAAIAVAALALAALVSSLDPVAMRLYLIEGVLLAAWFVVLHATHSAHRLPKEIAVGLFFSAATFIPTVARDPGLRPMLLPCAVLFAALCSLNCLFIYAWEHDGLRHRSTRPAHATTRIALANLPALAAAVAFAGAAIAVFEPYSAKLVGIACGLAAGLLLLLNRNRPQLSRTNLRAAADLALLTPALLVPFLR